MTADFGPWIVLGLIVAAFVACIWWLVKQQSMPLKRLGWGLAVLLVLFAGLIVLTQGGAVGIQAPGIDFPQEKWPDGGLEVAVRPSPSVTV